MGKIEQKADSAVELGFKCFLHPAQTAPVPAMEKRAGRRMAFFAVSRFDMAWTMACLYSDQDARLLHDFNMALGDAGLFIDKMVRFPGTWLKFQKSAVGKLLKSVFSDMALFDRFARTFSDMVRDFSQHDTALSLARLAPDAVPEKWPMAALTWCTANMALANHRGETTLAQTWAQQGQTAVKKVITLSPDLAVEFFNTLLVNAHNRFEFTTTLPIDLRRLLALLEKRYAVMAADDCVIDPPLGRLYGTLVQNSAFCGPGHIRDTEAWSRKARRALGEGSAPELEPEWVRQYSYLGSARLCAGDIEGARTCLMTYTGVQNLDGLPEKLETLSPWQISLLCRFLDIEGFSELDPVYTLLSTRALEQAQPHHPWQVICFHLGRAARLRNDRQAARRFFEKSLDICLAEGLGPTIRVMALKPLAFLQEYDYDDTPWAEDRIKQAARELNPGHFSFLFHGSFKAALIHVRENMDTIFPFDYQ